MSKAEEYRDQTLAELQATCSDLYKDIFVRRNEIKRSGQKPEKPHMLRQQRRALARALTVKREKQLINA